MIGEFLATSSHFIAAVEGKGPKDPLDRPFDGRKISAVEQGFRLRHQPPPATGSSSPRYVRPASTTRGPTNRLTSGSIPKRWSPTSFSSRSSSSSWVPHGWSRHGQCHLYDLLPGSEKVGKEIPRNSTCSTPLSERARSGGSASRTRGQPPRILERRRSSSTASCSSLLRGPRSPPGDTIKRPTPR